MISTKWPYPMTEISEDRSVPRVAVRGQAAELVGVDGRLRGGLQPFPGFEQVYELDFYADSNHDATSEVTDSIPVNFRRSNRSYAYGFVYRARRRRSGSLEATADIFLDFYDVDLQQWNAGNRIGIAVDPVAQMDVAVFGRLCYVFIAGRPPILFFLDDPPPVDDASSASSGDGPSSTGGVVLTVLGDDATPPLAGPGLKTELLSPEEAGALGSIVTTEDSLRPGRGQVVLTSTGPKELGLFEALTEENPFIGGGESNGSIWGTCPRVMWTQGEFSGKTTIEDVPVTAGDLVLVFAHRSGPEDQTELEGFVPQVDSGSGYGAMTELASETKEADEFTDPDIVVVSWHSWEAPTSGTVDLRMTFGAGDTSARLDWHVVVVRDGDPTDITTSFVKDIEQGIVRVTGPTGGVTELDERVCLQGIAAWEPEPYPIQPRSLNRINAFERTLTTNGESEYHYDYSEVRATQLESSGYRNLTPSKTRWGMCLAISIGCDPESASSDATSSSGDDTLTEYPELVSSESQLDTASQQVSVILTDLAVGQVIVAYTAIQAGSFDARAMTAAIGSLPMEPIGGDTPWINDNDVFELRMQGWFLVVTEDNIDALRLAPDIGLYRVTCTPAVTGFDRPYLALFAASYSNVDVSNPFAAPFVQSSKNDDPVVVENYNNSTENKSVVVMGGISLTGGVDYFVNHENEEIFLDTTPVLGTECVWSGDTVQLAPGGSRDVGYTLGDEFDPPGGTAGNQYGNAPEVVGHFVGSVTGTTNNPACTGITCQVGDYLVVSQFYEKQVATSGTTGFEEIELIETLSNTATGSWQSVRDDLDWDVHIFFNSSGSPSDRRGPWTGDDFSGGESTPFVFAFYNRYIHRRTFGIKVTEEMLDGFQQSTSFGIRVDVSQIVNQAQKPSSCITQVTVLRGVVCVTASGQESLPDSSINRVWVNTHYELGANGYYRLNYLGGTTWSGTVVAESNNIQLVGAGQPNSSLYPDPGALQIVHAAPLLPESETPSINGLLEDVELAPGSTPRFRESVQSGAWNARKPEFWSVMGSRLWEGRAGEMRISVAEESPNVPSSEIAAWIPYTLMVIEGAGGEEASSSSSTSSSAESSSTSSEASSSSSSSPSSSSSSSPSSSSVSSSSSSSSSDVSSSSSSSEPSSSSSSASSSASSSSSGSSAPGGFPDSLFMALSLRAAPDGDCEDFKNNFVVELLSPPNGRENVGVGTRLIWNGFYTDGRPNDDDIVYDVYFQVVGLTQLVFVATTSEETFDPGTLFANGDLPYGETFRWTVIARHTSLPDDCTVITQTWEFSTLEEFEARKIEPGDYVFGYVLYDSRTGRQSAFSEIAQCRSEDFPFGSDEPSRRIEQYAAMEILYDSEKYDQAWIYRSVKVQDAGGTLIASFQHLDAIVDLETYHTTNNGSGPLPESEPWRQAIYYYQLEDKQLVWQDVYVDLPSYDAEMPRGGTAVMFNNTMIVGKVTGGDDSSPEEIRTGDAFTGLGELRWSSITQLSPELFPPQNRYTPSVPSNEVIKLEKVAGNVLGFSKDRMYHIRREGTFLQIREMHEGFLGVVNEKATAVAGSTVYVMTSKGLKSVDGFAKLESVRAMDQLVKEEWVTDLGVVSGAYDPRASVLFFVNPTKEWVTCLWFDTAMLTELRDMPFTEVRQGAWPTDPQDYDDDLSERALFLMNSPDLDEAVSGWKPRIYVFDYERNGVVTYPEAGSGDATPWDGERRISALQARGSLRYTVTARNSTTELEVSAATEGVPDSSIVGSYVYCITDSNYGNKARIVGLEQISTVGDPDGWTLTLDRSLVAPVGSRVHIDAVYTRIVGSPVGSNNPQGGLVGDYYRLKKVDSLKPSFVDVSTYEASSTDVTFRGLVYDGSESAPTSAVLPTNEKRAAVAGVTDLETQYSASFGESPTYRRRTGVQGASLSPGIEIICADLDYRLLGILVSGSVQDSTIGEAPRANPS